MAESNAAEHTDEKEFCRPVNGSTTDDRLMDKEVYPQGLTAQPPTVQLSEAGDIFRQLINRFVWDPSFLKNSPV